MFPIRKIGSYFISHLSNIKDSNIYRDEYMRLLNRISIIGSIFVAVSINAMAELRNVDKTSAKVGLLSVYYDAVDNNSDLAAAKAQYEVKQEIVPQARAGLLPQISGSANYKNTRTALDQPPNTMRRNSYDYGISLAQPIFRIDRWFQLQAAYATDEQAKLNLAVTEQQLILQTAQVYFSILQAQDNLAATKAEEQAYKRQAEEALERFKLGLADKTNYLQAKSAYDMSRASRVTAEKNVQDAFQALITLTNRHYGAIKGIQHTLPIVAPAPNNAQVWVDKAIEQNISLRAGTYGIAAAKETVKQRKSGHAPTVDFIASYKRGDNDAFNFTNTATTAARYGADVSQSSVGIELQVPIYSGGMTSSQAREARSALMMSEHQQESLRRKVVQNATDYHRAINTDIEQIKALKETIISSLSAVDATKIGFQAGTNDIVDVLDAQRRLYDAVRNYNNARYSYIIDVLSLKQVVGTLSPEDLQALDHFLTANYVADKDFLPSDIKR